MSKYDNASLVQIPSGYKSGTLYSVLPANGDGDFDFTRASIATRVNAEGLIEQVASGVPRLDYPILNGVVQSCPALLLEPARTNLIPYSSNFSNAAWVKVANTVTSASAISPDGTNNAWKFQGDGSGTTVRAYEGLDLTADTTHYLSVFAKKGTNNYIRLLFSGFDGSSSGGYNLDAGTAVGDNASIIDYGNGWYKCVLFANITSPDVSGTLNIYVSKSDTVTPFDDTTEASNAYVYVYAAQLEAGSYATSYIPTSGSTVARAAEVCGGAGTSAEFNDSEGVLFAEISALADDLTVRTISISNGSSTNRVQLAFTTTSQQVQTIVSAGTVSFSSTKTIQNTLDYNKLAVKYKTDDFAFWINGFKYAVGTGATPTGINQLRFAAGGGSSNFYGNTKQVIAFDAALTDEQLEDLTSWDSFEELAASQFYTLY